VLFFPASRPDRYASAIAAGADAICIDLEDAVRLDAKDVARAQAFDLLRMHSGRRVEIILRINDLKTPAGLRDLLAVCEAEVAPDALMIPKVDSPDEIRWPDAVLGRLHPMLTFVPIVETPRALAVVEKLPTASRRIDGLALGGLDLSSAVGASMDWSALLYARSRIVYAAALGSIGVVDTVFPNVADLEGLRAEARAASCLGFTGKAAVHPTQVPVIQSVFGPSEEQVREARSLIESYRESAEGALLVDGKLVELPVINAARRVLAVASALKAAEMSRNNE
jgi:citrate lyase beta subunit